MSDIAIRVADLSKMYHIGGPQKVHDALVDQLTDTFMSPFRRARKLLRGQATGAAELDEKFWALKDISFEIKRGEVIGIIGRNGAGKSTLLKVLSKLTEPTKGFADIYGRVGSLLEVGTGFHPELTGRENIYLNGAILGMRKAEIERKFDEIVAFAEIDKFIDTPVKHYSSGMYVRLAFAVAAHLEPEILLVDEVLAVGDVAFQRKCLGKMDEVSRTGRTILFVSHNMAAIQSLCPRVLLIRQGRLIMDGPVDEVVKDYLSQLSLGAESAFKDNPERGGSGEIRLIDAKILDESNQPTQHLVAGKPVFFEFSYENLVDTNRANLVFTIFNHLGTAVTSINTKWTDFVVENLGAKGKFTCHIPDLPFPIGQYRVAVAVHVDEKLVDLIPNVLVFDVASSTFYKNGQAPPIRYATCMVSHNWEHEITTNEEG